MQQNEPIAPTQAVAAHLNQTCFCRTLDLERLRQQLESQPEFHGLLRQLQHTRPHLFSSTVVFISSAAARQMADTVAAVDRVTRLAGYRAQALARADASAQHESGSAGVCMGYDFHLDDHGPKLIEINTNAGGLLLNLALLRAQAACCDDMDEAFATLPDPQALERRVFAMFAQEWAQQRGAGAPAAVAIVDDDPDVQYLAPEFDLFRQFFERHGWPAQVCDARDLRWQDGRLWAGAQAVDFVYNRLTDFYFTDRAHAALRAAHAAGAAVVSPHPRGHALLADKRNLIVLGDRERLLAWGASAQDAAVLAHSVPRTEPVTAANAEALWARRRQLFFKPVAGYGAKAAYRGDKLTRRVWDDIVGGDFVAQALVAPAQRLIELDGVRTDLKFDIRAYAYQGEVQLFAARMYAGQTTNFRTAGGGFAPVLVVPDEAAAAAGV